MLLNSILDPNPTILGLDVQYAEMQDVQCAEMQGVQRAHVELAQLPDVQCPVTTELGATTKGRASRGGAR